MEREELGIVIARVRQMAQGVPGSQAYCDAGDALSDAVRLADAVEDLSEALRALVDGFAGRDD